MYARCPNCEIVHPIKASTLSRARGFARCGRCRQEFNALANLFDEYPQGEAGGQAGTELPVLGDPATLDAELELLGGAEQGGRPAPPGSQAAWYVLLVLLVPLTIANLAWTFEDNLLEWQPARLLAQRWGLLEAAEQGVFRDPSQVHLVSRDFHSHPSQGGMLVLSASFVSLAPQPQPYPDLAITLTDAEHHPLAHREFRPDEYLLAGMDRSALMRPGEQVPMLLEFVDPGEKAVGFELDFR